MRSKFKKILPWIALAGIIFAAILFILTSTNRSKSLGDSPETQAAASQAASRLIEMHPSDPAETAFLQAAKQAAREAYIAQVWLFQPDGTLVLAEGTPITGENATERATLQVRQALSALPQGSINDEQRMLLLVSSAMQAEGEHADVFRYQVYELHTASGDLSGYLGVAYDVNPSISAAPDAGYILSLLGLVFCLGVYWLGLALWVFLDARDSGERAFVWLIFVLIGNLAALIAYLLAKKPQPEN